MSRLRMLQVWMATVMLSTGLAVVPGVAAGSDGDAEHRIGCRAGCGCGQQPDLYGKG